MPFKAGEFVSHFRSSHVFSNLLLSFVKLSFDLVKRRAPIATSSHTFRRATSTPNPSPVTGVNEGWKYEFRSRCTCGPVAYAPNKGRVAIRDQVLVLFANKSKWPAHSGVGLLNRLDRTLYISWPINQHPHIHSWYRITTGTATCVSRMASSRLGTLFALRLPLYVARFLSSFIILSLTFYIILPLTSFCAYFHSFHCHKRSFTYYILKLFLVENVYLVHCYAFQFTFANVGLTKSNLIYMSSTSWGTNTYHTRAVTPPHIEQNLKKLIRRLNTNNFCNNVFQKYKPFFNFIFQHSPFPQSLGPLVVSIPLATFHHCDSSATAAFTLVK